MNETVETVYKYARSSDPVSYLVDHATVHEKAIGQTVSKVMMYDSHM